MAEIQNHAEAVVAEEIKAVVAREKVTTVSALLHQKDLLPPLLKREIKEDRMTRANQEAEEKAKKNSPSLAIK